MSKRNTLAAKAARREQRAYGRGLIELVHAARLAGLLDEVPQVPVEPLADADGDVSRDAATAAPQAVGGHGDA